MNARHSIRIRQVLLPALAALGDLLASFTGLAAGYSLRFHTALGDLGIPVPNATFLLYLPLMCVGVVLLLASFGYLNVYDPRLLLRRYRSLGLLFKGRPSGSSPISAYRLPSSSIPRSVASSWSPPS